jgi:hypothetical protein
VIDTAQFATDLAGMIADLPAAAKWSGRTFNCSISELTREETLILIGNITNIGLSCIFPVSAISGLPDPKPQARIEIQRIGEATFSRYEIVEATKPADSVAWNLTLKDDKRN